MKRDIRKTLGIGLLLCGLLHAWFGHDLFHGHHHGPHQEPVEAAHTTAVHRDKNCPLAQAAPVALLIASADIVLPLVPVEATGESGFLVVGTIERQFLERPQAQRAPPAPLSLA